MSCDNKYLGNKVVISFDTELSATGDPKTSTNFKILGLTNSKSIASAVNTIDVTTDETGSVSATLAVGETFDITASGFAANSDIVDVVNQYLLKNFYHTRLGAQEQPKIWVEIVTPAETIYVYCMMNGYSSAGASKEAETLEFTFSATATCDLTKPSIIYELNESV